jgi:hypothetical protein
MRRALAVHTRMEFLFRHLDGHQPNGVWWSYFFKPMAEAEDAENTMRRTDAEAIKGIMAAYTRKERAEWFAKKIQVPGRGHGEDEERLHQVDDPRHRAQLGERSTTATR